MLAIKFLSILRKSVSCNVNRNMNSSTEYGMVCVCTGVCLVLNVTMGWYDATHCLPVESKILLFGLGIMLQTLNADRNCALEQKLET